MNATQSLARKSTHRHVQEDSFRDVDKVHQSKDDHPPEVDIPTPHKIHRESAVAVNSRKGTDYVWSYQNSA